MKLSLCINAADEPDCQNFTDENENYEKISEVLEKELSEISPELKKYENIEISLSFVNSQEIRELNNSYRNIDESTDVLSFPMFEGTQLPEIPVLTLGDIVICPEEVARLHPNLKKNEGIYLIIAHSFLHLLGFDHDTEEKQASMWTKQEKIKNEILERLGF